MTDYEMPSPSAKAVLPPPLGGKAEQRLRESPQGGCHRALGRGLVWVPFLLSEGGASAREP